MEAVDVRGKFVWHQLMTRDVPGAKDFYSRLVGLEDDALAIGSCLHGVSRRRGSGCGNHGNPLRSAIRGAFALAAVHRHARCGQHCAGGGACRRIDREGPSDMQGAGRYAVLKDPQGAVFAIIDPENAKPEVAGGPPLGAFSWHELATSDNEAAFAFYSGLFGWEAIQRMDMGPARRLSDLRRERRAARRHLHKASRESGAAELAALCPCSQRR